MHSPVFFVSYCTNRQSSLKAHCSTPTLKHDRYGARIVFLIKLIYHLHSLLYTTYSAAG